eukprot:357089-Chlamydomonas_euryale.AAC.4
MSPRLRGCRALKLQKLQTWRAARALPQSTQQSRRSKYPMLCDAYACRVGRARVCGVAAHALLCPATWFASRKGGSFFGALSVDPKMK